MRKQPLTAVTLLFGAGIILQDYANCDWRWLVGVAGALLAISFVGGPLRNGFLAAFLVLTGAAALSFRTAIFSPFDLRQIIGSEPAIVTLQGTLTETPFQRVYERGSRENWRTIAFVSVDSMSLARKTNSPATGLLAVSTSGILPASYYDGQRVEITGVIQPPNGPVVDGMFDYRLYLKRLGIHYQLQVTSTNDWRIAGPSQSRPYSDRFLDWAQAALARGLPEVDEPLRLLWVMTLGWKTALSGEVAEPFMRSGTMHIFAISGLHIALIAAMIVGVLRCFIVPRSACALLVIPLIWAYTGITGWQASAIRSTVMTSVIVIGWSINRPSNLLNSLAAAALIILIWDPQQLFQAGFQLSFLVVLSLALISPVLTGWKERLLKGDPFLPEELRSRPERMARSAVNAFLTAVTTSLAAWLGSIPVVAYYFHFLTPSSLVANLIVVPLSSAALACNMATLALANWFRACTELFNHAAWCFMLWMIRISEWSADLPSGCFNIQAPRPVTFLFYYLLLAAVIAGWFKNPRWRGWCIGALLLLGVVWTVQWRDERKETRLTILPLHGGEAIYIEQPSTSTEMLVDGGDEPAVRFSTKQYLRTRGANHLSGLLLSHGDVRQMGGAGLIQELFPARTIYASHMPFRSAPYRRVIDSFQSQPHLLTRVKRGERAGPLTILYPDEKERFRQADDVPIVAVAEVNGARVLLLSDLTRTGQAALLDRNPDLKADIVISGLPKQSEPLSESLLEAVNPRVVIITDATYPGYEHANHKVRERLNGRKFSVWYTSDSGALLLRFKNGTWSIEPAIPVQPSAAIIPTSDDSDEQPQSEPEE